MANDVIFWAEQNSPNIADLIAGKHRVVLPIGSTEQHGPHLPVGTDHLNVWEVAVRLAEKVEGVVLPLLPYGCSEEHFPRLGTLSLKPETLKLVMKDLIESLRKNKVAELVILDGHGGQFDIVEEAIRELDEAGLLRGISIMHLSLFKIVSIEDLVQTVPLEEEAYVHAEEFETSIMLVKNPGLVDMSKAMREIPEWIPKGLTKSNLQKVKKILKTKSLGKDTITGVVGDPTLATAEKGGKILSIVTGALAEAVKKHYEIQK